MRIDYLISCSWNPWSWRKFLIQLLCVCVCMASVIVLTFGNSWFSSLVRIEGPCELFRKIIPYSSLEYSGKTMKPDNIRIQILFFIFLFLVKRSSLRMHVSWKKQLWADNHNLLRSNTKTSSNHYLEEFFPITLQFIKLFIYII